MHQQSCGNTASTNFVQQTFSNNTSGSFKGVYTKKRHNYMYLVPFFLSYLLCTKCKIFVTFQFLQHSLKSTWPIHRDKIFFIIDQVHDFEINPVTAFLMVPSMNFQLCKSQTEDHFVLRNTFSSHLHAWTKKGQ